tara:strand:+ start:3356 stop:3682 length:327 start_codon:yes stop_codon:yes gene_type:complete
MTRDEAEKIAQSQAFEWATDYKPWDEHLEYREYARQGYATGFMAAYGKIINEPKLTPKPTQRSWEIVGGDASAMGYVSAITDLNKAFEALEFLQETQPDIPWQLKENN